MSSAAGLHARSSPRSYYVANFHPFCPYEVLVAPLIRLRRRASHARPFFLDRRSSVRVVARIGMRRRIANKPRSSMFRG